jgi:2-methylisocitrate lyase-like PEP mutase family enzyme
MPNSARPSIADKRRTFRQLHETGCFAIPNPFDVGSACLLQGMGFKALASSSAGFAWTLAKSDNKVTLEEVLTHLRSLVAATDVPINADFENGFSSTAAGVQENVRRALDTGIAGLSIEDATGDDAAPLFSVAQASERIAAARRAIDSSDGDAILVGRAEGFLLGRPNLDEVIERLRAYAEAGADCLYAPGITQREQIETLVKALAPRPINLLLGGVSAFTLADCAAMGVRRVSVGGALARAAWGGFMRAALPLAESGSFAGFDQAMPGRLLNENFANRQI